MIKQATVALSSMNPAPYTVNEVSRNTVFVFNAGEEIYELIDPEGQRWVMQTWSGSPTPTFRELTYPAWQIGSTCPMGGPTGRVC
jgi:hypothetical protein